jgi:hypothetical protein
MIFLKIKKKNRAANRNHSAFFTAKKEISGIYKFTFSQKQDYKTEGEEHSIFSVELQQTFIPVHPR